MRFEASVDARCMRGLHWRYTFPDGPPDQPALREALRGVFSGLIETDEHFGPRHMVRLVRQFQFEIRLGERNGEVALIHRVSANLEDRAKNREAFEALLLRTPQP